MTSTAQIAAILRPLGAVVTGRASHTPRDFWVVGNRRGAQFIRPSAPVNWSDGPEHLYDAERELVEKALLALHEAGIKVRRANAGREIFIGDYTGGYLSPNAPFFSPAKDAA